MKLTLEIHLANLRLMPSDKTIKERFFDYYGDLNEIYLSQDYNAKCSTDFLSHKQNVCVS